MIYGYRERVRSLIFTTERVGDRSLKIYKRSLIMTGKTLSDYTSQNIGYHSLHLK